MLCQYPARTALSRYFNLSERAPRYLLPGWSMVRALMDSFFESFLTITSLLDELFGLIVLQKGSNRVRSIAESNSISKAGLLFLYQHRILTEMSCRTAEGQLLWQFWNKQSFTQNPSLGVREPSLHVQKPVAALSREPSATLSITHRCTFKNASSTLEDEWHGMDHGPQSTCFVDALTKTFLVMESREFGFARAVTSPKKAFQHGLMDVVIRQRTLDPMRCFNSFLIMFVSLPWRWEIRKYLFWNNSEDWTYVINTRSKMRMAWSFSKLFHGASTKERWSWETFATHECDFWWPNWSLIKSIDLPKADHEIERKTVKTISGDMTLKSTKKHIDREIGVKW